MHLARPLDQLLPQQVASTMEPRHHGADRYGQGRGDFLVGELLNVAEQNHLLVSSRDAFEGREQVLVRQVIGNRRDKRNRAGEPIVQVADDGRSAPGAATIAAQMLQDRDQPGPAIGVGGIPVNDSGACLSVS
jgi:hypothetical protein